MPIRVLNDIDQFQKAQRGLLERLGCQGCTSGFDIRYEFIRKFIVDEQLNIRHG